jgi:hypothetical protein
MLLYTPVDIEKAFNVRRARVYELLAVNMIRPTARTFGGTPLFDCDEVERALAHRAAIGDRRRRGGVGPMETKS